MSFLRGQYNPERDEITGCEEGELTWFHEKRHQFQHHTGMDLKLANFFYYTMLLALVSFAIPDLFWGRIFVLLTLLLSFGLEIDAWIYAIRMYRIQEATKPKEYECAICGLKTQDMAAHLKEFHEIQPGAVTQAELDRIKYGG